MGAVVSSAPKHQQTPPTKVSPPSRLPIPIPPGTAASKYEHIFMNHCEFRLSPVHGYGVFATQDIQPGTLIIREEALWVVDTETAIKATFSDDSADYSAPRYIMIDAFYRSNMDEQDEEERLRLQQDILALAGGFNSDEMMQGDGQANMQTLSERLREIIILNAVAESDYGKPDYAAVFRASSRLNHSCDPNAERMRSQTNDGTVVSCPIMTHKPDSSSKTNSPIQWCMVYAISPIKKGEEIFVNYLDPLARSGPRQKMFQSRWSFTCTCKLCSRTPKEVEMSDLRRKNIEAAIELMRDAQTKHAEPKPTDQQDIAYVNHLKQCDKATLGEAGWQVIEKHAAVEGVRDLKLFNR
jgi:hypothetical protein